MPVPDWRKSAIPSRDFPSRDFPIRDFPSRDFPIRDFPSRDFPIRDFPSRDFPSRDRKGAVLAVRELAPPNFAGRKMLLCHVGIDLNAEARLVLNG